MASDNTELDRNRRFFPRAENHESGHWKVSPGFSIHFKHISYISIPSFEKLGFATFISTRIGGVSKAPYRALNLAYHVGESSDSVTENRQRLCATLHIDMPSLVLCQQVHGDNVEVVDDSWAGRGAYGHADAIADTDAMVTGSNSIALGILTADCVPVVVVDPVKMAFGIAHAGWRGTLNMIASNTISAMSNAFGTEPSDCLAAFGPSIGPCCYEVGSEVFTQFQSAFGPSVCTREQHVDLKAALRSQLQKTGIKPGNILSEELCTACNTDLFYSYRAEKGNTGRMMTVVERIQ